MQPSDVYETGFDESTGNQLDAPDMCPECDGAIVADGGERYCADCGLIVTDYRIDHGATARGAPSEEEDPSHVGAPLTPSRHDRGLSTTIGRFRDGRGKTLDGATRRRLARLRVQHHRARHGSKRERNLERGCREVARLCGTLGLTQEPEEQAAVIFRRAQAEDLLLGRSIESMAAASVHAACRCAGLPRSIDEVVAVARVDGTRMRNAYRVLNEELGLPTAPQTPREFVPKYAAELDVSTAVRKRALELAEQAVETGVANGRQPSGIAGACLYQASREAGAPRTQATLAEVAGVVPVTLRMGWQALRAAINGGSNDSTDASPEPTVSSDRAADGAATEGQ